MHLTYRNVNQAFSDVVRAIHEERIPTTRRSSRVGDVFQVREPVIITYQRPTERVLFNNARDANPFFHLYEALWMLAGRDEVRSVAAYNGRMKEFSDDGDTFWGAYGKRWRGWFQYDQLSFIIDALRENPDNRRCVLAMWDAWSDPDCAAGGGKDVPCNTHAYFLINDGRLDMTVCNRSNDLVWGTFGANVVHMSMLQEYVALSVGVDVGVYNQMTNNLHCYVERWTPDEWIKASEPDPYVDCSATVPLVEDQWRFDREVERFVENIDGPWGEPFLRYVAEPMCLAFRHHKEREYALAMEAMGMVLAWDWRDAGTRWIDRRRRAWNAKQNSYVVCEERRNEERTDQE